MQEFTRFMMELMPSKMQNTLMSIGGSIGLAIGSLFDGLNGEGFYWLCLFVLE